MDFTFSEDQGTIARFARELLWAKHNELTLGPAAAQLARLGSTYPEGHL